MFEHILRENDDQRVEVATLDILLGLIKEKFFAELRTKQQLGYIVAASIIH